MAAKGPGKLLVRSGGTTVRGWIILITGVVLMVAVILWFLQPGGKDRAAVVAAGALYFGAAMFVAILVAILTDSRIRSVARYTFVQCLRLKLTAVFVVSMGIALALVYHVEGDGTLGGRIRNFLSYSNGLISLLLSVMTVFLSISMVTRDIQTKQIFTLATKPLARWEYIVGRWLGVVMLDAVLVVAAGVVIYGLAQHLRSKAAGMKFPHRRTVETEVFTARKRVGPDPLPLKDLVTDRLKLMRKQRQYENAVDRFLAMAEGDRNLAAKLVEAEIARQVVKESQSVAPQKHMALEFSGIKAHAKQITSTGRINRITDDKKFARVEVPTKIIGNLTIGAPLKIAGVDAQVFRVGKGFMDVQFAGDDVSLSPIGEMTVGKEVEVQLVSAVQLVYKAKPTGKVDEDMPLRGSWLLENPKTGMAVSERPHEIPVDSPQTFIVSAMVISDEGRTRAWYTNYSPVSVSLNRDDVGVLYRVGGFGWNLARGTLLVLFRCAYLAALGLLMGSALSFSISCMGCFVLYVIALGRGYMTKAVELSRTGNDLLTVIGHYVMKVMSVVLPDFARSSPVDSLVDGMYISWSFFGESLMTTVAFRGMLMLGLACLVFHRRELARVQV